MKFQCNSCKGIVVVDFEGDTVGCGTCGAVCKVPAPMSEGVVIDDFLIVRKLGSGGMGDVYLAHEFSLDRKVALKILKDSISKNDEVSDSFIKEARSVASLNHPNIIQAHKVGFDDGVLFFAMEYVQGQNLQDILKSDGMMEELQVLTIASEVVTALGYAWEKRQLIHRDIKPENIMISNEDGRTKLMDLGLSCHAGEEDGEGDQISGTPQYISPEQIMGTDIDVRTDFYCLGATLYHLLSGQFPFRGNLQEIVKAHLSEAPRSLKKHRPDLNENTVKIVHKLMKKDPNDRYSSADKLLKELEKTKHMITNVNKSKKHIHIKPTEVKTHYKTEKRKNRKDESQKMKVLAVLGLVLLLTFGGILYLSGKMLKAKPAQTEKEEVADTGKTKITYKMKSSTASLMKEPEETEEPVEKLTRLSPENFLNLPDNDKGLIHHYSFDSPENFTEEKNSLLAIDTKNKAHLIVTKAKIQNGFLKFEKSKGSKAKISGKLKDRMDETLKDKTSLAIEALIRCDDKIIMNNGYLSQMVGEEGIQLDSSKYYYYGRSINFTDYSVRVFFGIAGEQLVHKKFTLQKDRFKQFDFVSRKTVFLYTLLGMNDFEGEVHELRIWNRFLSLNRAKEVVGVSKSRGFPAANQQDIPNENLSVEENKNLIAYEGFDYKANTQTWKSGGGFGWKHNWWTNKGGGTILEDPLVSAIPISRSKHSIQVIDSDIVRTFGTGLNFTPLYRKGQRTFYLSYLLKVDNPKGKFYSGFIGYTGDDAIKTAGIGNDGETKTFKFMSGKEIFSIKAIDDQVNLIVIRLDFDGKLGQARVYFNPDLDKEPVNSAWQSKKLPGINFGGVMFESDKKTSLNVDEVRYGTTYESVTPKQSE